MSQLGRTWSLGDIADVEAFALSALDRGLRRHGAHLAGEDRADALAELIARCWELHDREYDPARGVAFASFAGWQLQLEVIEILRRRLGRNGHRRRLEEATVSLDEQLSGGGELGQAVAAGPGDGGSPSAVDLRRLLGVRDRPLARAAVAEVIDIARTAKGVARLLAELRAELTAQAEQAAGILTV